MTPSKLYRVDVQFSYYVVACGPEEARMHAREACAQALSWREDTQAELDDGASLDRGWPETARVFGVAGDLTLVQARAELAEPQDPKPAAPR